MALKIISGGQTGADVAGLWAAKLFGIPTGGWAPKDFVTLDGNHPEMKETFGMKEHSGGYRQRTIANLKEADLTIVCSEKMSAGTKLTIDQCKKNNVPCFVFQLDPSDMASSLTNPKIQELINLLNKNKSLGIDTVVNVAGNSTKNSARAFEFTYMLCFMVFFSIGYNPGELNSPGWKTFQDKWA